MDLNCQCTVSSDEHLYVISVVSNPACFKRRYQLFEEYKTRMESNPKVILKTIELQLGSRPFMTSAEYKIRSNHNLWHKENLINYVLHRLPQTAKYIAWIDSDISFQNEFWAEQTISKLQTYEVVQPWSQAIDMNFNGEIMKTFNSFCYMYNKKGRTYNPTSSSYDTYYHPGYAWAFTRNALNKIGGMLDVGICGSSDHHMACCFVGKGRSSVHGKVHKNYLDRVLAYNELCERHVRRNIGYVPGIINHYFHGKKRDRQYRNRWNILIENKYDPVTDVSYDINGILQFNGNKPDLEYDLRTYSASRNEDSIDHD
jgi:hypothetical protein